ncbi:hypothetical protein PVAND_011979 [Polypedilum vanderplanki]|uniref:Microsomal glutathione S-transferase 1 n=1 Tax=Polypedilum vanderplanki TaxID=319348 RepID=A0A9J6CL28_POLVA|nr:hypothetical protein PVAND_011979 [Polypedilum vanderplanki]
METPEVKMTVYNALNADNHAFRVYITWGGFLIIKMLLMSLLTGITRSRKNAFENPEDLAVNKAGEIKKDEDVERVRRAHMNDLENIPAFLFAALMYVMSNPHPIVAAWLIRVAVLARILHTIFYALYPLQPFRSISWAITLAITIFMIIWAIVMLFQI